MKDSTLYPLQPCKAIKVKNFCHYPLTTSASASCFDAHSWYMPIIVTLYRTKSPRSPPAN